MAIADMKAGSHTPAGKTASRESAAPAGGQGFFEQFHKLPDQRFRTSDSGLKVAAIGEGNGLSAGKGMSVAVRYTGWTDAGHKFDSSQDRNQPFEFILGAGNVIKGWEEGLIGAKPGDRLQLVIPPALAYGNRQVGEIPPGATLVFNVEVVSVTPPAPNSKGTLSVVA